RRTTGLRVGESKGRRARCGKLVADLPVLIGNDLGQRRVDVPVGKTRGPQVVRKRGGDRDRRPLLAEYVPVAAGDGDRPGLGQARQELGQTGLVLVLDQDRQRARGGCFAHGAGRLQGRVRGDRLDARLLAGVTTMGQSDEADAESAHTGYMPSPADQVRGGFVAPGRAWKHGLMYGGPRMGGIMELTRVAAT